MAGNFVKTCLLVVVIAVFVTSSICQAQVVCPPAPTVPPYERIVYLTADGMYYLYVDGALVETLPHYDNATAADHLAVPVYTRLLAINAIMFGQQGGIIASVNGGEYLVTSSEWKCSSTLVSGWEFLGFDDSSWPSAVEIGLNGNNPVYDYGCIDGVSPDAYWIWTSGYSSAIGTVHRNIFCRGYIPVCEVDAPCQNGGTCLPNSDELCVCPPEYSGTTCEIDMNPCRSSPCQNGGTCVNADEGGEFTCICNANFTGILCETMLNACESSPCLNGGTCINGGTFYVCDCTTFFTGTRCETEVPPDCGQILHNAESADLPAGWDLGCYIGHGDEVYWNTPCYALLQGLSYYGSSDALLAAGGNYGCWTTNDPYSDTVYNACYDDYQHDVTIRECSSCVFMGVCVRFP
jgi:hypothetical protein